MMNNRLNCAKLFYILIPFVLHFNLAYTQQIQQCNTLDKNTLLKIKKQFGNPSWLNSWNTTTNCCQDWSNKVVTVSCDDVGRVNALSIVGANNTSTKFPPAIGDLPFLNALLIDHMDRLHGQLPASAICKLTTMESLYITFTNLTGPIPDCIGQLKNLLGIALINSGFTGPIPPSIGSLPKLDSLYLKSNKLSGPLPRLYQPEMSFINLAYNNLTGTIPTFLGKLSKLSVLDLSHNQFYGPILPSLGLLPSIYWLDLSNNRLNGKIPYQFGSLRNSTYLQLQNNQLIGLIPKSFARLDILWIDVSSNKLNGDASILFQKNKMTERILINNNHFKFNLSNVELPEKSLFLNIKHNKIYGSVPRAVSSLLSVDMSYNHLCGRIPRGYQQFGAASFAHNKCLCGPPLPQCKY